MSDLLNGVANHFARELLADVLVAICIGAGMALFVVAVVAVIAALGMLLGGAIATRSPK